MDVEDDEAAVARVKQLDSEEPLLQENPRRFVVFPINYLDVWQFYKKAQGRSQSSKCCGDSCPLIHFRNYELSPPLLQLLFGQLKRWTFRKICMIGIA